MKKLKILASLTILIFLILIVRVWASPYLVCDPQAGVDYYEITGDITANNYPAEVDGSIRYDLIGIAEQIFNIEIKACNKWGCSMPAPFSFTKQIPKVITGITISP